MLSKLSPSTKRFIKVVARQTLGRMPPSSSRLTGKLAMQGGKPVRDVRLRPWPNSHSANARHWSRGVGREMRRIFVSGNEGLPQTLGKEFAQKWAAYCGVSHALILPHGTDALRLALAAALDHDGLTYGGEVIVPNFSFVASANAALDRRFGVVLVDVDPKTLSLDPQRTEEAIIPGKTRAIMPVHLFGQPADMSAMRAIALKYGLKLIEDAAQAHGAIHELGMAGSLGDAAGFSFQSFKNISSGEGGALTTNDPGIFERAWQMHNVGRARIGGQRWGHETLGWNCRATEYVAAVLLHRLQMLEEQATRRHSNYILLRELFKDIPSVELLDIGPGVVRHSVYNVAMRYRPDECSGLAIDEFVSALVSEGLPGGRSYSTTISQQPVYQKLLSEHSDYVRLMPTPVSDSATLETLAIDQNVFLGTKEDMDEIAAIFRKVQHNYAPKSWRGGVPTAETKTELRLLPSAPNRSPKLVRCGIIGFGAMGRIHAAALKDSPSFSFVAVTDVQRDMRPNTEKFGAKWFESPEALIQSKEVDAVIIATPHWQHAELAIAGLAAGLHVICEKPLTVTVAQADRVLEAARSSKGILAAVHQVRFDPVYQYAKQILDSGDLGPIYRCSIVESTWRTNAYYKSSPWRATWRGEGGGVLLNQAPHILDRYAWLCGMPETVWACCDTLLHPIEVEDVASALLRHRNGAHGYIHVTSNECPVISQTTIACDSGRIHIENGRMRISKLSQSIRHATANDQRYWGDIAATSREIPSGSCDDLLVAFYANLAQAVNDRTKLVCSGATARDAVELANAFILSSARNAPVTLPLDRAAYEEFMTRKTLLVSSHAR
jgi:dTDP-4-amino-4,6-dideoxygalactose transaminase/predicted dehydrogenase